MILVVTPNPCIDKTLFVENIDPQAKIKVETMKEIAGGKGSNVSRVLRRLGLEVGHFVLLGGYTGERVWELMAQDGVPLFPAWLSNPTRVVTTVVDRHWRQVAYFEPGPVVSRREMDQIIKTFEKTAISAELVVFCGSVSDLSANSIYYEMIQVVKKMGKKTIIDSRGIPLTKALKAAPWMVKMNREEAEETRGKNLENNQDFVDFFEFLGGKGVEYLILTFGERGAWLRGRKTSWFGYPPSIAAVNPVGSGDSFLAAFLSGLVGGKGWDECLRWGVAAGAANARTWDAAAVTWDDIQTLLPEVRVELVEKPPFFSGEGDK